MVRVTPHYAAPIDCDCLGCRTFFSGPATLSEPDCKEVGRKELGDFFELRGGYSLGRQRQASIPHKKASSLRHAIRE